MQNSTLATEEDRNLVLDYRLLHREGKTSKEILQSQRLHLFSQWWFMMTIFSHLVITSQVNSLAHNTELGHNGKKKCTAASQVEPDKNLKILWYFWVLKKQAHSKWQMFSCEPRMNIYISSYFSTVISYTSADWVMCTGTVS